MNITDALTLIVRLGEIRERWLRGYITAYEFEQEVNDLSLSLRDTLGYDTRGKGDENFGPYGYGAKLGE